MKHGNFLNVWWILIMIDQINNDSLISSNAISTKSGKQTHEPIGPTWYEEEQTEKGRESQRQS